MPLLQSSRLTCSRGTRLLFRDIELTINSGDRIGLVGHNGSGKSTLLSILSGATEPDSGVITRARGVRLATVEQFIGQELLALPLGAALAERLPLADRQDSYYRVEQLLFELGFSEEQLQHRVSDLSGGQQNRLMFARAVIREPDLILFDEPTNHLDLASLQFFEACLARLNVSYLLVSHDRAFLDSVTSKTLVLRDQRLYHFNLAYSAMREKLDELDLAASAKRAQEGKQIAKLKESAKRLATWGKVYDNEKLARKAKTMEKRIGRMEENLTQVKTDSGLRLSLDLSSSRGNRMLKIENQRVDAPNGRLLFEIEELTIRPGDRLALLGHNGVGKTTLIAQIMAAYQAGEQGTFADFSPKCRLGYYDQELQSLSPDLTLKQTLRDQCPGQDEKSYKMGLIDAGFPYLEHGKQIKQLSGGERARIMFLIMRLNRPSLLILDEPTNHLDIEGKEELETELLDAGATLLITSHDRRFVDRVASRFLAIYERQLVELAYAEAFYTLSPSVQSVDRAQVPDEINPVMQAEDEVLHRIVELESLIATDLARKKKFRKPGLQATWLDELQRLNRQLD